MHKKALSIVVGLSAGLMAGQVNAQSSVTVYGVADIMVEHGKAGTQAAPTSVTRLLTGGMQGSRLGFRGTEDLGGGLKANFVLEHGLLLDSGNPAGGTTYWNRQSFVGLSGGLGSLSAGRQYSPLLVHQDTFDAALSTTGYGSPYNSGVVRTISRVNNSVLYRTPELGGVSGALMLGLGENTLGSRYGRLLSGSVKYAGGPLAAGAAYVKLNKADASREDKSIWNLSGSYQFGDVQLIAGVQGTKNDSQAASTQDDRSEFVLGAVYTFGLSQIRAAFGQGKVKDVANTTARHVSLGYLYNLSKRTALYTAVQSVNNPDNLAYRGSNGFTFDAIEGGVPAGAGVNARAVAVGIRHRF